LYCRRGVDAEVLEARDDDVAKRPEDGLVVVHLREESVPASAEVVLEQPPAVIDAPANTMA
jgi:hypothetical protein